MLQVDGMLQSVHAFLKSKKQVAAVEPSATDAGSSRTSGSGPSKTESGLGDDRKLMEAEFVELMQNFDAFPDTYTLSLDFGVEQENTDGDEGDDASKDGPRRQRSGAAHKLHVKALWEHIRVLCFVIHSMNGLWERAQLNYAEQWKEQWNDLADRRRCFLLLVASFETHRKTVLIF